MKTLREHTTISRAFPSSLLGVIGALQPCGRNIVIVLHPWCSFQHWHDAFLRWEPEKYGNLSRIIIPPNLLWLPDFGLENRCAE